MIDPETLHTTAERHIRCNPALAQFIVEDDFAPVIVEGPFDKRTLDPAYVREQKCSSPAAGGACGSWQGKKAWRSSITRLPEVRRKTPKRHSEEKAQKGTSKRAGEGSPRSHGGTEA